MGRSRAAVGVVLVALIGTAVSTSGVLARQSETSTRTDAAPKAASQTPRIRVVVPGTPVYPSSFNVASRDGAHVFITTETPLFPGSTDRLYDVVAGRYIPVIPHPGAFLNARLTTPDGQHVVVQTDAHLTPDDTDGTADDLYLVSPGSIERITTATDTMYGKALFMSDDGSEILLSGLGDVYRWVSGASSLELLTPDTDEDATFLAASADGSRILIQTDEPLTGVPIADGIYEPTQTGYTLRGAGVFRGMSEDGSRVFSRTIEVLSPDDIYGDDDDAYLSTDAGFELLTPGPYAALDIGGISADGSRWLLDTEAPMSADDLDTSLDVYLAHDGVFDLISAGDEDASSSIMSADGRFVVYMTTSAVLPEDVDTYFDLYRVDAEHLGQPVLLSQGDAIQGLGASNISDDGRQILIQTDGKLLPQDQNNANDVYVWRDGDLSMLAEGANSGVHLSFVSDDRQRILFSTNTKLDPLDINGGTDIYSWDLDTIPPVPTVSGIAPYTTVTSATFQIGAVGDDAVWFDCRLDDADWARCGSSATFEDLAPGPHTFEVHAFDAAANRTVLPTIRSWTVDLDAPQVTPPTLSLLSGTTVSAGRVKARIAWTVDEPAAAIDGYELSEQVDGGPWAVAASSLTAPSQEQYIEPGHAYVFRARATDRAGNVGTWQVSAPVAVAALGEKSSRVVYTGPWKTVRSSVFWGGRARKSSHAGATASINFVGHSIAWISRMGPNRGKARILVNGDHVATIDLRASTYKNQRVVWVATWATAASRHVTVNVRGTAGRPRIDLDGFVTAS